MPETHWYFKLFNSVKEKHEIDFAELELTSLFGNIDRVRNFSDLLDTSFFKNFRHGSIRIQDIFAHELPYGECHGFFARTDEIRNVGRLVKRLAYTREFFAATSSNDPQATLRQTFPAGDVGKNVQYFQNNDYVLLRFITNQYFLEKSQYISKLSRNELEASRNVEYLFSFLTKNLYRIPATETMQIGKRLEDYFAIREEPSLHLTHYMHPYKGKFHPKMVRALLNYVFPKDAGTIMDNFAGCGTLLVEATWMELDSIGVEINPLSALMCNVKCDSLTIPLEELKKEIDNYLQELRSSLLSYESQSSGSALLFPPKYDKGTVEKTKGSIPASVMSLFRNSRNIDYILIAHELLKTIVNEKVRDFLLLALSGATSDLTRRRHGDFLEVLQDRLRNLYLRIYIFDRLNNVIKVNLGKSKTYAADTRDMKMIQDESVDAIVNSPPYSTALDYIKNDYPQLTLLGLADISQLEVNMIGNPRFKVYQKSLLDEMRTNVPDYARLPQDARETLSLLVRYGRLKESMRTYKFFKDMFLALKEMYRVLKRGSKCVIIIGNNHYKLDGDYAEVKNDEVLKRMALTLGFKEDRTITRVLEKTQAGMIRYESILILEKPAQEQH
jgi:hypothetical protein